MKKTLNIDVQLLAEARAVYGVGTDTETIHLGLQSLLRQSAQQRLRALRGSQPDIKDVPRRREAGGSSASIGRSLKDDSGIDIAGDIARESSRDIASASAHEDAHDLGLDSGSAEAGSPREYSAVEHTHGA
jgi:Arc/MetJ family transcription regulator